MFADMNFELYTLPKSSSHWQMDSLFWNFHIGTVFMTSIHYRTNSLSNFCATHITSIVLKRMFGAGARRWHKLNISIATVLYKNFEWCMTPKNMTDGLIILWFSYRHHFHHKYSYRASLASFEWHILRLLFSNVQYVRYGSPLVANIEHFNCCCTS